MTSGEFNENGELSQSPVSELSERVYELYEEGGENQDLLVFVQSLEGVNGDNPSAQTDIEGMVVPEVARSSVRDALFELYCEQNGGISSSEQEFFAKNDVMSDIYSDVRQIAVSSSVDGRPDFSRPEVMELQQVLSGLDGGRFFEDYFNNVAPEGRVADSEELRTPHDISEQTYQGIFNYVEHKISSGELTDDKLDSYRVVRNMIHREHRELKDQFDLQKEVAGRIMGWAGEHNDALREDDVRLAVGNLVGDKLSNANTLIETAISSGDGNLALNTLLKIKRGDAPLGGEEFEAWMKKYARKKMRRWR